MNAAAHKLFGVPSEAPCQGADYQHFLEPYIRADPQQSHASPEQWLMNLVLNKEAASSVPEDAIVLHLPFGREVAVTRWNVPIDEAQKHLMGTAYTFHNLTNCHQRALHLQRVHEAILTFSTAIGRIPEQLDLPWPEETLLAPPVVFVAQQLVDIIRYVLSCRRVSLLAKCPSAEYLYFVAGSGISPEQELLIREKEWKRVSLLEVVDETARARLNANQVEILTSDHLPLRPVHPREGDVENLLMVPMFLQRQLAGILIVVRAADEGAYLPEDVALVKAVAAQARLIIEGLCCLHAQVETQTRARVLCEVQHLSNDFLTLASHELRTPLTGIMGNLQLAQRRLEALKYQINVQTEHVSEHVACTQQPLDSAAKSASLLQCMINDLIDDARIQTNQLALSLTPCDLLTLLKAAVARQQHAAPEHAIVWKEQPAEQSVPIFADEQRIIRVLTTYLSNAYRSSPGTQPVTVALTVENAVARVSVYDEGPGIPADEQAHLWDRFYHSKWSTVQNELDLSFGLALYLCRVLIEQHQGSVGMQSAPGEGTTFWLTLPLAK
ncbi:hypothetical protein KSX_89530 [Ktedonospora formicarum]|uniref:histidine kinase n=2 Tax=Ktedonospora formicarum TaxID=2778364 RepID=A0A8J3ICP6_9CHLR|nr:hypothetical protein KSX_89530 [Ktedonospora formicarum]